MKIRLNVNQKLLVLSMLICCAISCKKDLYSSKEGVAASIPRAVYSNHSVDFNNWTHGSTYTNTLATADFGNIVDYSTSEEGRMSISSGTLKVNLDPNVYGTSGGVNADINVTDRDSYELTFKVRFHSAFDWAPQAGGILGFGQLIGDGITGSGDPTTGEGGSFRVAWKSDASGNAYFTPYVYAVNSSSAQTFGVKYPATGSLQKGVWYTIKLEVKSNSRSYSNGLIKMSVDGTVVYENKVFKWTSNDSKRYIKNLVMSSYRGTNGASSTQGQIYFDDFSLKTIDDNFYYKEGVDFTCNTNGVVDPVTGTKYWLTFWNSLDGNGNQIDLKLAQTSATFSGEETSTFASRVGSTIAFNASTQIDPNLVGDTCKSSGIQIIDGIIKQDIASPNRYTLGIKSNNQLKAYRGMTASQLVADGVKYACTAFIPLIENHSKVADSILNLKSEWSELNQRQVIAQFDNNNFVLMTIAGDGKTNCNVNGGVANCGPGMGINDIIRILGPATGGLNVKFAFMLDGGGSTSTVLKEQPITPPWDKPYDSNNNGTVERKRPSFLYIKKTY